MPKGPSIVLFIEAAAKFAGEEIIAVSGNSKIDQSRERGRREGGEREERGRREGGGEMENG